MNYDVIIVGGGASGIACAVSLINSGRHIKILLVEAGERLGKKLAATGNGQGNVSNADMTAAHFHGGNVGLAAKISCDNPFVYSSIFDCVFVIDESGRVYPSGKQASALVDGAMKTLKSYSALNLVTGEKVTEISRSGDLYKVNYGDKTDDARFIVLCTGGKAQKQFKTDGSAYKLATGFGHSLTPLYPSLVQIKTDTDKIKTLKGIRVDCEVCASVNGKPVKKVRGDVIFTEYGLSGNAIFSISPYIADKQSAEISLSFLPDISATEIENKIYSRKKRGYEILEILSGILHNQLGRAVVKSARGDSAKEITENLKRFNLKVAGTLGFDYAQVTKGGIDMSDVSDELESNLARNLFFAGEILDVDGDCGGYNLQWAFTSGAKVAENILKRL